MKKFGHNFIKLGILAVVELKLRPEFKWMGLNSSDEVALLHSVGNKCENFLQIT